MTSRKEMVGPSVEQMDPRKEMVGPSVEQMDPRKEMIGSSVEQMDPRKEMVGSSEPIDIEGHSVTRKEMVGPRPVENTYVSPRDKLKNKLRHAKNKRQRKKK